MQNQPEHSPILVQDPFSGKAYDVLPLFAFLDHYHGKAGDHAEKLTLEAIKYLTLNFDPGWVDGIEMKNNLGTLWQYVEFWQAFNERRRQIEKEEGGQP
jgi:hypothetical protein